MKETIPDYSETNAIVERADRTIFTMNRTILAEARLPKGMWHYASAWSAYVKNRVPHKSLKGASPMKRMFPETDLEGQRSNLSKFGEKVTCFDYTVTDTLSSRSFQGRISGYTHTHGVYQILDKNRAIKLAKNPRPIIDEEDINDQIGDQQSEEEPDDPIEEPTQPIATEEPVEPPPALRKGRRKAEKWKDQVGTREPSKRIRQPTWKIQPVGSDPDHLTEQQAQSSSNAHEWAKARIREREQLEKYGVFSKVNREDIPEGTKIVDTKWVYVVKRSADGSIEKYKARKVG